MIFILLFSFVFLNQGMASSFKVQDSKENITITSQQVEYETASQTCHIMGQAKAAWDSGQVITAHTFLVSFNKNNEIQRIDATSNTAEEVTFKKDDLTMWAKKCVYTTMPIEQIHCFQNVKLVKKGSNTLDGDECIVTVKTGKYKIISKGLKPVQAKVISEKKARKND